MDNPEYRPPTKHAKINFAIIRCLRDTGDGDYIAARLAARHRLVPQFLWSAEPALEKYLKGILTLHRVSAPSIGHDISKALRLIKEDGKTPDRRNTRSRRGTRCRRLIKQRDN